MANKPKLTEEPTVQSIAKALGATPAQVLVAFGAYRGYCVIPKSVQPQRIESNFQQIELSEDAYKKVILSLQANDNTSGTFIDPSHRAERLHTFQYPLLLSAKVGYRCVRGAGGERGYERSQDTVELTNRVRIRRKCISTAQSSGMNV